MFMVKDEYKNAKNLLNIKIKNGKYFMSYFIVAAIWFIASLATTVFSVFYDNNVTVIPHTMTDISTSFFFGMILVYIVGMFTYRQVNDNLSVFPQTNNSRFIATQLLNYVLALFVGLTALTIYLLNYGVLKLLPAFKGNIHFALNFEIGFIIVGFFIYAVYSFLIIAVFGFIGAILRKWKYYAIVGYATLFSLMVVNLRWVFENIPKIFAFLVSEPIPAWFMLKGIALWLVITAVSLVINNYTVYHQSQKKTSAVGIALMCVIVAVITMIIPAVLLFNTTDKNNSGVQINEIQAQSESDYYARFKEIRIDVSHLPKGSKVNVTGENISFPLPNTSYARKFDEMGVLNMEVLDNLQGDTIIITYQLLEHQVNGIELYEYANPQLDAYLSGDTLHIDYTYEKAHVIIMPIWGIAGQFDCYKDKGTLPKIPWGYSSGGGSGGTINIRVE